MESSGVSKSSSCLPNPEDINPLTFRSDQVQPAVTSMEIMDSIDSLPPAYGDCVDIIAPYTGGRHNRLASERTYTGEVVGTSRLTLIGLAPLVQFGADSIEFVENIDTIVKINP